MDQRGGAEWARPFYNDWPFVQKAVSLYAASVGWGGCSVIGFDYDNNQIALGELTEAQLTDALPDYFIDGRASIFVSKKTPLSISSGQDGDAVQILSPASGLDWERGNTLLWPACSNYPHLQDLKTGQLDPTGLWLLKTLLGFAYDALHLPEWALDSTKTRLASVDEVTSGLQMYRIFVNLWRNDLIRFLEETFEPIVRETNPNVGVVCRWNKDWLPSQTLDGWTAVYEVFAQHDLPLVTFGKAFPEYLRTLVEAGLVSTTILDSWRKLGLS